MRRMRALIVITLLMLVSSAATDPVELELREGLTNATTLAGPNTGEPCYHCQVIGPVPNNPGTWWLSWNGLNCNPQTDNDCAWCLDGPAACEGWDPTLHWSGPCDVCCFPLPCSPGGGGEPAPDFLTAVLEVAPSQVEYNAKRNVVQVFASCVPDRVVASLAATPAVLRLLREHGVSN